MRSSVGPASRAPRHRAPVAPQRVRDALGNGNAHCCGAARGAPSNPSRVGRHTPKPRAVPPTGPSLQTQQQQQQQKMHVSGTEHLEEATRPHRCQQRPPGCKADAARAGTPRRRRPPPPRGAPAAAGMRKGCHRTAQQLRGSQRRRPAICDRHWGHPGRRAPVVAATERLAAAPPPPPPPPLLQIAKKVKFSVDRLEKVP